MPSTPRPTPDRSHARGHLLAAALILALLAGAGCANDPAKLCAAPGGAVSGAPDTHCGTKVVVVDPNACDATGVAAREYGDTLFNAVGIDDDCKYNVAWTATAVCSDTDIYFTLTLSARFDDAPKVLAKPTVEAFLTDTPTHGLPDSGQRVVELGGGSYRIGPVRFDAAGQWTVRFHFYPDCADTEASPNGHAAFFVDVP